LLAGSTCGPKLVATEKSQAEIKRVASHGLVDDVRVPLNLVSNGGPYQIGSIGIKTFFDQEIDLAEINVPEIDRYLL
jgi:hypothetical protein